MRTRPLLHALAATLVLTLAGSSAGAVSLTPTVVEFADQGDSGILEFLRVESGIPAGAVDVIGLATDQYLVFRLTLDADSTGLGQFDYLQISRPGTTLPFSASRGPGRWSVGLIDGPGVAPTIVSTATGSQGFLFTGIGEIGGGDSSQELLVGAPSLPIDATIAFDNEFPPGVGAGFVVSFTVVPEPATTLLLAAALTALAALAVRRRTPL